MFAQTKELRPLRAPAVAGRHVATASIALAVVPLLAAAFSFAGWMRQRESDTHAPAGTPAVVASIGQRPSHNRRYHAEVVSATPFAVGVAQSWTVRLTGRSHRRLANARLAVRSWAPETGEVSPVAASAHYLGGDRYRLDGIYFSRPGWWNVALIIDAASGIDSVAFNIVMPVVRSAS